MACLRTIFPWVLAGMAIASSNASALEKASPPQERVIVLSDRDLKVVLAVEPVSLIEEFGPRFDNTAAIKSVSLKGHSFFKGSWGMPDEFGVLGLGVFLYESANIGEPFGKMGVGELLRKNGDIYYHWEKYAVQRLWPVEMRQDDRSVTVRQTGFEFSGYAYTYEKSYHIDGPSARLSIQYSLTNTGKRIVHFDQYTHNWFCFDQASPGSEYQLSAGFSFPLSSGILPADDAKTHRIKLPAVSEPVLFPPEQLAQAPDNWYVLSHPGKGLSVRVSGDFPVARCELYMEPDAVCPEIFVRRILKPGQNAQWTRQYVFRVDSQASKP